MEILSMVEQYEKELIEFRRYFHTYPELSGDEENTCQRIKAHLTELGIPCEEVPDGGILGFIRGREEGKTVLLRADVDALPIEEDDHNLRCPKACVSKNQGISHACGHDAHTAMLLSAARVLQSRREHLQGKVILMFERGEEKTTNCIKIFRHMEEKQIYVDSSFAIHMDASLDSGKIAVNDGPVMASNVCFDVKIKGTGGHGSRPDLAVNPLDCFVAFYSTLNSVPMRKLSPFHPFTFSICHVEAGSRNNVIPEEVFFRGSSRFYDKNDGFVFKQALTETLDHMTRVYGCTYEYTLLRGPCMPVINDGECAALTREALGAEIGSERICSREPQMGSETFGKAIAMWPGVYALLGTRNDAKGTGAEHHNAKFDIDDQVLKYGAAAYAVYAEAFLASDIDLSPRKYPGTFADMYEEQGVPQEFVDYLRHKTDALLLR